MSEAGTEIRVLDALRNGDAERLAAMLSDDFLITTAGWIPEPANWLDRVFHCGRRSPEPSRIRFAD